MSGVLTSLWNEVAGKVKANGSKLVDPASLGTGTPSASTVLYGDNTWGSISSGMPRGYIDGLILSNNSGTPNTHLDIAVGACRGSANAADIVLASALTKRLDQAWAVGNNNGGLDTGSKANSTWYHVHVIKRSDTSVVDALFSTSATSPTMPTNYDIRRRVGAIRTDSSGNILAFRQLGDRFEWETSILDYSSTSPPTTGTLQGVTVPGGIAVTWQGLVFAIASAASQRFSVYSGQFSSTFSSDVRAYSQVSSAVNCVYGEATTNSSSQIRIIASTASNWVSTGAAVQTNGWIDPRGKNG